MLFCNCHAFYYMIRLSSMTRPLKKIQVGDFQIGKEEKKAINKVLDSGRITEGPRVQEFEIAWAKFIDVKYAVATSSGFGALVTSLAALKYHYDLPQGTKVISSPTTYIADSSAVSILGFEPVYIDVDAKNFCLTAENIENFLKKNKKDKKIKIILPVDQMGFPVEIDKINKIAQEYGLLVLEDAAEAEGTIYKGRVAGSEALMAIYSFYVAHNFQVGEMGAVTTNNEKLFKLTKKLKAQGRLCDCYICTRFKGFCPQDKEVFDPRFYHQYIGFNFKPMEFQAVIGLVQLKKADWIIKKRRENVKYLNKKLKKYEEILQLPPYLETVSYLAYPLVIKKPKMISRKKLCYELERLGVETRPLFPCIPTQQPAYKFLKNKYQGKLPNAEYIGDNGFYLGCHQYLTKDDLEYIINCFEKVLG